MEPAEPPFRVFGNTYYVGTAGLSAVLVTSPGAARSCSTARCRNRRALIDANIRTLGFRD